MEVGIQSLLIDTDKSKFLDSHNYRVTCQPFIQCSLHYLPLTSEYPYFFIAVLCDDFMATKAQIVGSCIFTRPNAIR